MLPLSGVTTVGGGASGTANRFTTWGAIMSIKTIARLQHLTRTREEGATAVEYGLMVALIAIVIIAAVTLLGGNLSTLFNSIATSV